jgi:thiamine transport system ATP-binding protein
VATLDVRGLVKTYGSLRAVDAVSFNLQAGQVLALLGPSGSGKSTLLSLLAGLETPDAGDILWDGQSLLRMPTHQRGFGLMFQDYALFPHKDVAANVAFGLKMQGRGRAEARTRMREVLALVGMADFEGRDVNTLSGGEQQRVALARALAPRPRLLMLDEPLGALDRALRERLLEELRAILRRLRQTAIYVTHDQEEAFALADKVIILRAGQVAQRGTPAEVYARPASPFVAGFLGLKNLLPARVERQDGRLVALTPLGTLPLPAGDDAHLAAAVGQPRQILLRSEGIRLAEDGQHNLEGELLETSFRGSRIVATLRAADHALSFEFPASQALPAPGQRLRLQVAPAAVHLMARTEDEAEAQTGPGKDQQEPA